MFDAKDDIDRTAAEDAVSGFLTLPAPARDKVRIALERLNLAMRRLNPGDQAVELAVALEALVMGERGANAKTVSLRAALIIGGTQDERRANRAAVGGIYAIRNSLLHEGNVRERVKVHGKGQVPIKEVVHSGIATCKAAIFAVIKRRALPDWYDIELGA